MSGTGDGTWARQQHLVLAAQYGAVLLYLDVFYMLAFTKVCLNSYSERMDYG